MYTIALYKLTKSTIVNSKLQGGAPLNFLLQKSRNFAQFDPKKNYGHLDKHKLELNGFPIYIIYLYGAILIPTSHSLSTIGSSNLKMAHL